MNFSKLLQCCILLGTATAVALPSGASSAAGAEGSAATATNYRITVINNSGFDNNYGVFLQPPVVSNVPGSSVWTNAWILERAVNTGAFTVNAQDTFYAWLGEAPQSPVPGVVIQGGVGKPVPQLGSGNAPGTTFILTNDEGTPNFISPNPPPSAPNGGFQIITDSTFTNNNLFMLGLGAINPNSGIIGPAGVISAAPNIRYTLTPLVKFYVSVGVWQPGEIVDIDGDSEQVGIVDFSSGEGLGNFGCNLVQDNTGHFTANYTLS